MQEEGFKTEKSAEMSESPVELTAKFLYTKKAAMVIKGITGVKFLSSRKKTVA